MADDASTDDSAADDSAPEPGCSVNAASIGRHFFGTVQEALENAVDGDVVHVCPGTHYEHLSLTWLSNPSFKNGATISIVGDRNTPTIIDGGSELDEPHGATIFTQLLVNLNLSWLTVTGGTGERYALDEDVFDYEGGGVNASASLTLDHVSIVGNTATFGGGIAIGGSSSLTITNSVISGNDLARGKKKGFMPVAGGVALGGELTTLDAIDTDWGSGATDNQPDDIGLFNPQGVASYRAPIDATSVHCDNATLTCVFDPPKK